MLLPEPHALTVLILTAVALVLFTREKIPLETSALLILILLAVIFEVFPYQSEHGQIHAVDFFHGFGHEALIAVTALMIAGHGLVRTGALEPVGRGLFRLWKLSPALSFFATLVAAGLLSAFINNTPIVVLLLPILINISRRMKSNSSSLLMPMGFATLLGGTSTTIGTSTNLLVVGVAADMGLRKLNMFDFFVPAFIAGLIGMIYLWLVAPRLLPERKPGLENSSPRIFTAHLLISEHSPAAGKKLSQIIEMADGNLEVEKIRRSVETFLIPLPDVIVQPGDRLLVHDTPAHLKQFEEALKATLYSDEQPVSEQHPLQAHDQQIAEIVVFQGSPLLHRTASEMRFVDQYQFVILAIHRADHDIHAMPHGIENIRLRVGDVLLVQGKRSDVEKIKQQPDFMVLDATTDLPFSKKAPFATLVMLGIIVFAASGLIPIAISASAGVLLMLLCGCLNWRDVGEAVNAQVILVIVVSLALGNALLQTGGSDYLAEIFIELSSGVSPIIILSSLMLIMAILTNVVSNNAAAVIGTPIAISIARSLNLDPEPFVLAVLFGANMSYATPMAYQTNLLVMSAGNYTFFDFVKVGVPLIVLMWIAYSLLLPMIYF